MTSETYEIYRYVFLGGAILAGIMLAVSVFVFFKLKIADVIGYFTGANKRKAVEQIKLNNENAEDKINRTGRLTRDRRKMTDKISPSGKIIKNPSHSLFSGMETEKIGTEHLQPQNTKNQTMGHTEKLAGRNETVVLTEETGSTAQTTLLSNENGANETTVLNAQPASNTFVIEYEITYIHTNEVID